MSAIWAQYDISPILLAEIAVAIADMNDASDIDDRYCRYWYYKVLTNTDAEILSHAINLALLKCHIEWHSWGNTNVVVHFLLKSLNYFPYTTDKIAPLLASYFYGR